MISFKEIIDGVDWMSGMGEIRISLTQSFAYGNIQKNTGRGIKRFAIINNDVVLGYVQFVSYPLFGKYQYWYAPYGPVLKKYSEDIISGIKKELRSLASKNGVVFARLDFVPTLGGTEVDLANKYFTLANKSSYIGAYFQPREEWYTRINKTPEEILGTMHSKTRYSVRLAEKKSIKTNIVNNNLMEKLPVFLSLMKLTSVRNGFSLHNDDYYRYYFEEIEKTGKGFLIEALFDDIVLATHFVFVVGEVAHFVFGASSDEHKDLCAPYLAHFDAMLKARDMGAIYYNFGAVSLGDENKKWQGLSVFKQKFGGGVIKHSDLYDLVLKPFWYYIYIIRKIIKNYV